MISCRTGRGFGSFRPWTTSSRASRRGGTFRVTGDEPYFASHFPGNPIVPGVLIVEALAQLAGIAAAKGKRRAKVNGRLVSVNVRFDAPAAPPAELMLEVTVTQTMGRLTLCDVAARLGERGVCRGELVIAREA